MVHHTWNPFLRPMPWLYWSPTVIFFATSFYVPKQISGRSMQPTLNPDSSSPRDTGLFDRTSARLPRQFKRDDVVAFQSPENRNYTFVKRIIGIEGDVVRTLPPCPDSVVRVPQGHVWVEGDEPFFSDDSNLFGPIPVALIDSKLVGILWPLHRFGRAPKPCNANYGTASRVTFEKDKS